MAFVLRRMLAHALLLYWCFLVVKLRYKPRVKW